MEKDIIKEKVNKEVEELYNRGGSYKLLIKMD